MIDQCDLYKIGPQVVRDACLYGDGWIKFFRQDGRVKAERKHPMCLMVDLEETLYGQPRQLFERSVMAKDTLKNLYPQFAKAIELASPVRVVGRSRD